MKQWIDMALALLASSSLLAAPPEIPSDGRGSGSDGGQQPGGGGNLPDQPGGGGGGSFNYDTFLTDSTTSDGCIVYGVYTMLSATNGFARIIYSLTW